MKKLFRLLFRIFLLGLFAILSIVAFKAMNYNSRQLNISAVEPVGLDKELSNRLAQVVTFATNSYDDRVDTTAFRQYLQFLSSQYPLCDSLLEKSVINEFSLIYKWPGKNPKLSPILLMGHSDVVPVEGESIKQWTEDPYGGKISDGYIWGRGTLDDKVNILGILEATERLLLEDYQPMRTVYFAFGHDEEVGGEKGAAAIARRFQQQGLEFEYIMDEGMVILEKAMPGLDPTVALIGIAEKGYATLELTARLEKGGHSSMPPRITAIGLLSEGIKKLENQPFPARINGPTKLLFDYVGPEMNWPNKAVFANMWLFEKLLIGQLGNAPTTNAIIRTTTAPTMLKSGVKDNVLPTEAKAWVNFRIFPGETVEDVIAHVGAILDDERIVVQRMQGNNFSNNPSPVSEVESFGFTVLQRSIKEIFPGVIVAPSLVIAATDARHYSGLSKNIYRFSPLQMSNDDLKRIHGIDERISEENYEKVILFFRQLIVNSCK